MLDTHCKREGDAESLYRRVIHEEPNHPFALYNLAVLLEERLALNAAHSTAAAGTFEENIPASEDGSDCKSKSGEGGAERIHSDPAADDLRVEEVIDSASVDAKRKETSEKAKLRESLTSEVRSLYQRAVHADPSDVATAADFGRYLALCCEYFTAPSILFHTILLH